MWERVIKSRCTRGPWNPQRVLVGGLPSLYSAASEQEERRVGSLAAGKFLCFFF